MGYRPELDVVRCLGFVLVFVHHFLLLARVCETTVCSTQVAGISSQRLYVAFRDACAMGLCLFFALSAYLITNLLLDERARCEFISVRRFYIRRVLRIWPLYFVGIAIGSTIAILLGERSQLINFAWFLLFAGNFHGDNLNNPMLPLWSISIEEQFYLVWPWIVRWTSRGGLLVWVGILFLLANATLFFLGQHHVHPGSTVWSNTFVQFEMFATGALLAILRKPSTGLHPFLGLSLVVAGPTVWFISCLLFHPKPAAATEVASSGLQLIAGYGLVALGCAALLQGFCLLGAAYMPLPLVRLGKISYGLYVYHVLVAEITLAIMHPGSRTIDLAIAGAMSFVGTICVAAISYSYLEAPFLRWKRRFEVLHTRPI